MPVYCMNVMAAICNFFMAGTHSPRPLVAPLGLNGREPVKEAELVPCYCLPSFHSKIVESEMFSTSGNKSCCLIFIKSIVYFEKKFVLSLCLIRIMLVSK